MPNYEHLNGDIGGSDVATSFTPWAAASGNYIASQSSAYELISIATDTVDWGNHSYKYVIHGNFQPATDGLFQGQVVNQFGDLVGVIESISYITRYILGSDIQIDWITEIDSLGGSWPTMDGNDTFIGSNLKDFMRGNAGDDAMRGNGGDDFVEGGTGSDSVFGNAGNDLLVGGGGGNDLIYGGAGNDDISGADGLDTLYGGFGDDFIHVDQNVGPGKTVLDGGAGADVMDGGFGDDVYVVDNAGDQVLEDSLYFSGGYDTVLTTVDFQIYTDGQSFNQIECIDARYATHGVTLSGNAFTMVLRGSGQDDLLIGGNQATHDHIGCVIYGGGGNDTVTGNAYDDTYYVDSANDVVFDQMGGFDTVYTTANYTLGENQQIERLYSNTRTTGLALTGNEIANIIRGGRGADSLSGGLGIDKLTGGAGADTFILQNKAASRDRIVDFTHGTDVLQLSESLFGELDGPGLAFEDRFLANTDGKASNGGTHDTRIIYNTQTGALYFDANGTGVGKSVMIATLLGAPVLDAHDFLTL